MSDYKHFAFIGLFSMVNVSQLATLGRSLYRARVPSLAVRKHDGTLLRLSVNDAAQSHILRSEIGRWTLRVDHRIRTETGPILKTLGVKSLPSIHSDFSDIEDDAAVRALATILPLANQAGGNHKTVESAVTLVTERSPGMALLIPTIEQTTVPRAPTRIGIGSMAPAVRLALEMTLHEEDERRALDGELAELETRWREAEEIAGIADNLLMPADLDAELERLRRSGE